MGLLFAALACLRTRRSHGFFDWAIGIRDVAAEEKVREVVRRTRSCGNIPAGRFPGLSIQFWMQNSFEV